MTEKIKGNQKVRTYFGHSPQPFKDGYYTKDMNIKIVDNELVLDCTRCHKVVKIPVFKIHPDGAITFSFHCGNCQLDFCIYRNQYEDYEKVRKALYR